jgi:hypothetical protein
MKRFLPIVMLLMTGAVVAPSANADLIHRLTTSTQLNVDGAATVANRVGATYSVSGNNISVGSGNSDVFGGLTAPTSVTASSAMTDGTYNMQTAGSAFSFS